MAEAWALRKVFQPSPDRPGAGPDSLSAEKVADRRRRDAMADLKQFTADPNAGPPRILPCHPQDQLAKVLLQAGPTDASPPAEGCPLPAYQLAMPAQDCLRLDQPA